MKQTFLRRACAVSTFHILRRRPEALISILTLFYNLGDIGAVAVSFSTKLADNVLTYLLYAHVNFHAQKSACRATVAQKVSPQKHWTLGAAYLWRFRPSFQLFRLHILSYNSPISRFCPSGDANYGEWAIEDDSAPGCPGASIHSVFRGISSLRRSAHLASSRNFCVTRTPYSRRSGTASFVSKLCSQFARLYVQKSLQIQSRSCCARVCTPSVP